MNPEEIGIKLVIMPIMGELNGVSFTYAFVRNEECNSTTGVRVELRSKSLAKIVGKRLFEELIEFRNSVGPEDTALSSEQRDQVVKETIIQTVETTLQRQNTLRKQTIESSNQRSPKAKFPIQLESGSSPDDVILQIRTSAIASDPSSAAAMGRELSEGNLFRSQTKTFHKVKSNVSVEGQTNVTEALWKNTEPKGASQPTDSQKTAGKYEGSKIKKQEEVGKMDFAEILQERTNLFKGIAQLDVGTNYPRADMDVLSNEPPAKEMKTEPWHTASSSIVDEQVTSGPAVQILRQEPQIERDESKLLTKDLFEIFMGNQITDFMTLADPGGTYSKKIPSFVRFFALILEHK